MAISREYFGSDGSYHQIEAKDEIDMENQMLDIERKIVYKTIQSNCPRQILRNQIGYKIIKRLSSIFK